MKQKLNLEVGVKYRGYGLVNEYGEVQFIPEQTGINVGKVKTLLEGDGYKVSTTKNRLLIHLNIEKCSGLNLYRLVYNIIGQMMNRLKEYDFTIKEEEK